MCKTIKAVIIQLIFCTSVSATIYYVSPTGNNNNTGTSEDLPFQVVQFGIDQMKAGDILIILDGFYTGTLHLKSGITIQAKNPRKAIFSGATPLPANFEQHTDKIYKTRVDKTIKQLFFNDMPMIWAQWPDIQWSENWIESKKWALAKKGTGPGVLTSDDFSEVADLDLLGGYCFLRYGKGNSCYSRLIEAFDGDTLHWNDDNFYTNTRTGEDGWRGSAKALLTLEETHVYHPINSKFFLAGDLDLLNAPGEWYVEDTLLYIYPPDGTDPNEALVLAKTIDYCIYQEQAVSDVIIEGIDFLGGSVKFQATGNKNIHFFNTYFTYPGGELLFIDRVESSESDKPIEVEGSNISFEKCLFAGSRYTGLKLAGSEITVKNCVFMENNRNATFEGRALGLNATGSYKITRNTFFNNHSDAIRITINLGKYIESVKPDVSYNNAFNAGKYNSDVSGIYMPTKSQKYTEVHHNWIHNVKGNAFRLDVAGKELSLHHNVFWQSKRGMSVEGYGLFNIYNNTDVHNHVPSDLLKNILNHTGATDASFDSTFAPIDDWNVLNNIVEAFNDGVGPREKTLWASQVELGLAHPERMENRSIAVMNRGAIQGNIIGENSHLFTNGDLSGLNLLPKDSSIMGGVEPGDELIAQNVTSLDSYRGAYNINGEYWYPGSDWMPYGLNVVTNMADAETFAKAYYSVSIIPEINAGKLAMGYLNTEDGPGSDSVNLALDGTATQSSTDHEGLASRAIDGNTDGIYSNGSVTHTTNETNPWWELDLGNEFSIAYIKIFGRTNACCIARLSDFTVFVYNSSGTEVYSETFTSYPDPSVISYPGGVMGQKIRIRLNGSNALSLAEVQVFEFELIKVSNIVVSPDSVSLTKGDTKLLSALLIPSNAENQGITWNSNDTSVATINSEGFIMTHDTGSVIMTATTLDGAYSDECVVRVIDNLTSHKILPEDMADNKLILYPNPVNSILNFDFRKIEGTESIAIYSLLGQQIFMQEIESSTGYIDISGLESGVYLMRIHGRTTVVTRLVKE